MPLNGWTSYILNQSPFDGEKSKDIVFIMLELMQCNHEVLEFCDQRNQVTKVAYENIVLYCTVICNYFDPAHRDICFISSSYEEIWKSTVLNAYFA